MRPDVRDLGLVWDMRKACRDALQVVRDCTEESLQSDRVRQLALERAIEILGEAAREVSDAMRTRYPDIEWEPIAKQRHVIAHHYGSIEHARLWRLTQKQITAMLEQLDAILDTEGAEE